MKGFTILEVLVAVALVGVAAMTGVYLTSALRSQYTPSVRMGLQCDSVSRSVMDRLIAVAGPDRRASLDPSRFDQSLPLFSMPDLLSDTELWGGTPAPMIRSGTGWEASLGLAYSGTLRYFETLYNRHGGSCTDYFTNPIIQNITTSVLPASTAGLSNLGTQIRIQPFDLDSGQLLPSCEKPLYAMPRGISSSDPNRNIFSNPSLDVQPQASARRNIGFRVTLRTELTFDNESQSCELAQDFSLAPELVPPVRPSVTIISTTFSGDQMHSNSVTTRVAYPGSQRGVAVLCRDRSTAMPVGNIRCYSAGGNLGRGPGQQFQASFISDPRIMGLPTPSETSVPTSTNANSRPADWPAPRWQKCSQVTLCGQAPTSTSSSAHPLEVVNTYNNLRSGCVMRIEAMLIDAAGNLDTDGSLPTYNPRQISSTSAGNQTHVPRPSCPYVCDYNAPWSSSNPYLQTEPCCVGAGCVVGQVSSPGGSILTESRDPFNTP